MLLCERFGYDEDKIRQQLKLVGLVATDHQLVTQLHARVVGPHMRDLVSRFYDALKQDQRFWEVMSRGFSLPRLHRSQVAAFESLGRDFDTLGYFERRLRIGVAHARVGVPLELYLGSYRILALTLFDHIAPSDPQAAGLRALVLKLVVLEMAIVAGTYHRADMDEMQRILLETRSEADVQRERARRDSLTAIFNKGHVTEVLETAFERARHGSGGLAVAILDVDQFKHINDAHGHAVGDEALREVVTRVHKGIRTEDTLGRYGGDELLLVLEGIEPPKAFEVVDRLRQRVSDDPFRIADKTVEITLSGGLACLEDDASAAQLFARADEALYRAKSRGRNQVCFDSTRPAETALTLDGLPAAAGGQGSSKG